MRVFGILFFVLIAVGSYAQDGFKLISKGQGTSIYYKGQTALVQTALEMLVGDSERVAERPFQLTKKPGNGAILVGIPGEDKTFDKLLATHKVDVASVAGAWEAF